VKAAELIDSVKRAGGVLELKGDKLRCRLPKNSVQLRELLHTHKFQVIEIVKARGGRIATFPRCPRCGSYALYREGNPGSYEYECEGCGLRKIDETTARRVQ
jgi:predicted RNA-binding Zn-ribbon protein involved in translation (DUF1610 family)